MRLLLPLGAAALLALTVLAVRRIARRQPDTDMRLTFKRHSQRNRAYWFSLPPIERPK